MEQAALMVVPVRAGGGMRVRILEAFARAMPVVTTTVGLEGIDAAPGRDVLVADTPPDFARDVLKLLRDEGEAARLAENGRLLATRCYDWQVVLTKMDEIYGFGAKEGKESGSDRG
jgi:glycosyltransferase involved in cell wall biosynthesis